MGISTISMAIFHCYVSSPEGIFSDGFSGKTSLFGGDFWDVQEHANWGGFFLARHTTSTVTSSVVVSTGHHGTMLNTSKLEMDLPSGKLT